MKLPESYGMLYDQLLAAVGGLTPEPTERLTAFTPRIGSHYKGELFVVGRAVNGWDSVGWMAGAAREADGQRAIREAADGVALAADGCPMTWVTRDEGSPEYNTRGSAFWRVTKTVATKLHVTGDPFWSSTLAWSNLYKVAPHSRGNPTGPVARAQDPTVPELLLAELEALRPRRVLALTGRPWFEWVADRMGLSVDWRSGLVEGIAQIGGRTWVIARHPQGKAETTMASEILTAFADRP